MMDKITRFYVACCEQADALNRVLRDGPDAIRTVLRETTTPSLNELFRDAYAGARPESGRAITRMRRRSEALRNQAAEIANYDEPAKTYPLSWSEVLGEFNESRSEAWGFCEPESATGNGTPTEIAAMESQLAELQAAVACQEYEISGMKLGLDHYEERVQQILEKRWHDRVGTAFPGFSNEAVMRVAALARIPHEEAEGMHWGAIYNTAIVKLQSNKWREGKSDEVTTITSCDETEGQGMSWQDAAERMERLRQQGEPFTSQNKLATQLGCSPSTINKAIQNSPSLQTWAGTKPKAHPRSQSIVEVVADRTAQSRELSPDDDAAIREFIEDADPESRAWFMSLTTDAQINHLNDPDANLTTIDPVSKGKGLLHKRILNRKP